MTDYQLYAAYFIAVEHAPEVKDALFENEVLQRVSLERGRATAKLKRLHTPREREHSRAGFEDTDEDGEERVFCHVGDVRSQGESSKLITRAVLVNTPLSNHLISNYFGIGRHADGLLTVGFWMSRDT